MKNKLKLLFYFFYVFGFISIVAQLIDSPLKDLTFKNILFILLTSGFLFFLSHLLRALRIWIMVIESNKNFNKVLEFHFVSALLVMVTPFKLGEIYRFIQLNRLCNNKFSGISAFFLEKFVDAISILTSMLIFSFIFELNTASKIIIIFLLGLTGSIALLWVSLDGLLDYIRKLILIYSRSSKSLVILKAVSQAETFKKETSKLISHRFNLIIFISLLAWFVDLLAVYIFLKVKNINTPVSSYLQDYLSGITSHLSQLTRSFSESLILEFNIFAILNFCIFIIIYAILKYFNLNLFKLLGGYKS